MNNIADKTLNNATIETEIKNFINGFPYWQKYIANLILKKNPPHNGYDIAYSYLLEELRLKQKTERPEIIININSSNSSNYKYDLFLTKIENVEGVNALVENQIIEFNNNVTIIYGANGSGKSGYVRLLKNAFYSKEPEKIIQNINLKDGHKPTNAKFTFKFNESDISLFYPLNSSNVEFEQYAVFDNKSVIFHLDKINEFVFRPAALSFFADFTEAINTVETKLKNDITNKKSGINLIDLISLFEGESEIKTFIQEISSKTKIDDLKKLTPFSAEDKTEKEKIEKQYDDIFLASKERESEIKNLGEIKKLLIENRIKIEAINCYFTTEYLLKVTTAITDFVNKEATAKEDGFEKFNTDKILNVGTKEWKSFINAAEQFAKNQKEESIYPEDGDNCLLCHQPLSEDAKKLIINYWVFIESIVEENLKESQKTLADIKICFEKLSFDLFPAENTLTAWLSEKKPTDLAYIKQKISKQKELAKCIISDINTKTVNKITEIKIDFTTHENIEEYIDSSIKMLSENTQHIQLLRLLKDKTNLAHKEKFNIHFSKFETYINNDVWIEKAKKANFSKTRITKKEKELSKKYFSQKYIDTFNQECINLNGNFGIEIDHTGSAGKSHRQLKLKGVNPYAILSEGEQKVIAIADFLCEMKLSEVNRGIIFDDPVTSLDETRKSEIAERLVDESLSKQVIIFTHDLVFVYHLINHSNDKSISHNCHWIISENDKVGNIYLNNTPSHDKKYRNTQPASDCYAKAKDAPPEERERQIKYGFAALRTCYETFVINDLFANIVQRFNDRVSVMSLSSIYYDDVIINEIITNFERCCKYMEGHTHSDNFVAIKLEPKNLYDEIVILDALRKKHKKILKDKYK